MWLLLRPKAPISEHPSRVNVFRGIKHCWHDHGKTFINTCHWSNTHWVGKGVCFWDLKAQDSLVTRWLPIISILLVRWKKFAQPCPLPLAQQQKTFSPIFIAFSESAENSVYLEKKDQVYSLNIPEVRNVVTWILESSNSEHPSRVNVFKGIKYCWHDHGSIVILTIHWSNTHWIWKVLCFWDLKS